MNSDDRELYDSVVSNWENEGGAPAALPKAELNEEPVQLCSAPIQRTKP